MALLKIYLYLKTEKILKISNKNGRIMKKMFLLFMAIMCGSFAFAILPTPALVTPAQAAINQDVNVTLDWGNVTGATYYEYKLSSNPLLTGASTISTGSNSYAVTSNLLFNTTYYWVARARSTTDSSNWTSTFQFTTHDIISQVTPSHGATAQDVNVTLDWANVNGITNYDVEFDTNATFNSSLHQFQTTTSTYSYYVTSNLLFATKYYWRVRARHATDTTSWSSVWNFTTLNNVSQVTPTNGSTAQDVNVTLDWNSVNGITNYDVEFDTNATFNSSLHQFQTTTSTYSYYVTSNLLFATKYYWRVRARHATDTTSWSSVWNFTTLNNVSQVTPTNGATAQDVNVTLDWNSVNGITNYDVEFDTNATFNSALHQFQTTTSTYSYYVTSNLLFATKYYWRVRARHATDTTSWSPVWNFTTHNNVSQVTPTNGATAQDVNVTLDWNSVNGITNYDVEFDTNATFNSALHQFQTTTSTYSYYVTSNLLFATKYYWRVRARHATDTTSWSTVWNFTTLNNVSLVTPTNGATAQDVNVTLDWNLVNGITNYDVEFDTNATFNSSLHQFQTTTSTYSYYNTSNLHFATKYYWRVRARHSADTTSWSTVWNFTTTTGMPVHVSPSNSAISVSLNPTLDWNLVNGITAYQYEYSIDSNFIGATPVGTGTTSQVGLTSLSYGETYFWRVRTYHSADTSDWTTPWKFTTLYQLTNPVQLSSPANATTGISTATTLLQWQTLTGAVFYEYIYANNASFSGSVSGTTTGLSVTSGNLSQGTTYYWKVRANNGSGYSPWSVVWTFSTTGIGTPILLSPSNGAINQPISNLILDWQDASGGTFYEYQYGTDVLFTSPAPTSSTSTVSTVTINGLSNNTTYYWRVRTINGTNQSSWSTVWSFTTAGLEIPTLISPTNGATNQLIAGLILDWGNTLNAVSYEYQYCTDAQFISPAPISATNTISTATINGLSNNTTYFWRVRSYNGSIYSSWSTVWSFTTVGVEIPTLISPANGATNQVINSLILDWGNTTNAVFYEYQYDTDVQFTNPAPISATTTVSTAIINGLTNNTTYFWRVRTNDGNNFSSWSTIWSFTTVTNIGISENTNSIEFYPNPSKDFIFLNFESSNPKTVCIYDLMGKLVLSSNISDNQAQIDIHFLAAGSYIIKIIGKSKIVTRTLIKE